MSMGLDQLIWEITRPASQACLDHIYVTNPDMVYSTHVPPIGLSDHCPVVVVRKHNGSYAKMDTHRTIKYRNFKNFNEQKFQEDLHNTPWNILEMIDDPNERLEMWESMFLSVVNSHAPLIEKRVKVLQQPLWWSDDIQQAISHRDYLCHLFKQNGKDPATGELYRRARNSVTHMVRMAKTEFYSDVLQGEDIKAKWNAIRSTMKTTTSIGPKLKKTDDTRLNACEISNKFNDHFSNIGTKYRPDANTPFPEFGKLQEFINGKKSQDVLFRIPNISYDFVYKQIKSMSNTKATGLDNIGIKLLKAGINEVTPHITDICNLSIDTGIFPDNWKKARVVPIFKSGDPNDFGNYRPISVLPICSKIIERHVYDHYYEYLTRHHLLLDQQSGFRKHHSCQTVMIKLTDYFIENIDKGELNGVLLIDLRKAFDLVDHDVLLHKISLYGVHNNSFHWFKSYLSSRKQCVSYDGHISSMTNINLGVPQGSILGPLMFILFMNDAVLEVEDSEFEMYADDSTLCCHAKTMQEINHLLTENSKPLYKWVEDNRMVLNIAKTESMLISTVQRLRTMTEEFSVGEGEFKVTKVDTHKLLGIHIDNHLTWDTHVSKVCSKVSSRLYILNKTKYLLPLKARTDFFNGLIQPLIDYGCVVWGNCARKSLTKIHRLMKKCARSILDVYDTDTPTVTLFKELNWVPVDVRIKYFEGIQVYNIIHGNCPRYLRDSVDIVNHGANTRNTVKDTLIVPQVKLVTGQRSFRYRAALLWNQLDSNVKQAQNVSIFKDRFMKYLQSGLYDNPKFSIDLPQYYTTHCKM